MIKLFKHKYFKYLLLVFLALKGSFFVAENSGLLHEVEISYLLDFDDLENENEEKKEIDEKEKIHQHLTKFLFRKKAKTQKLLTLQEKYQTQYIEFTTPPPEFS